jgi:hypothetical protein
MYIIIYIDDPCGTGSFPDLILIKITIIIDPFETSGRDLSAILQPTVVQQCLNFLTANAELKNIQMAKYLIKYNAHRLKYSGVFVPVLST